MKTIIINAPIKLSDIDENGDVCIELKLNIEQITIEPEPEPEPEEPPEPILGQVLFDEDIALIQPISTPYDVKFPLGLLAQFNMEYKGAFRPYSKNSVSSSNHAQGALAYCADRQSIFMAGHDKERSVAEYKIPASLTITDVVKDMPVAECLQNYVSVLPPKSYKRNLQITGLLAYQDSLIVTHGSWYDGGGSYSTDIQAFNITDINQEHSPLRNLQGNAYAAGYMSAIPDDAQSKLGGNFLLGWASNKSITSRYSQGASLYTFKPQDVIDNEIVSTSAKQYYPMELGKMLVDGAHHTRNKDVSPIWGPMSKANYGFIVPNSNIFVLLGSHAGIHSGIFYKEDKEQNTRRTSGSATYDASDYYNYYWLYNVDEILAGESPWSTKPFSYGKLNLPFKGHLNGATFDGNETLYITVSHAGAVGKYDRPPLILSYSITAK